ncbi:MAG: type II toxin-antitoxin system RelE/ParE family toxin [Burkholderiaceae bacterium]|nr:type II toxin-antitoxin system RelE/ParE family toxin [Burkholderiaceae bacterium]
MTDILHSHRAREDLKRIWRYTYQTWGEAQANRYLDDMNLTIERLAKNPELGSPRDHIRQGYRAMLCGRHLIFFTVQVDAIRIVRVLHERMDVDRAI